MDARKGTEANVGPATAKTILKLELWTQSQNSWDSTCQVWLLGSKHQLKRHGEGRERRFVALLRTCREKRLSQHSAIFGVQT
jgi:hypothetical protein